MSKDFKESAIALIIIAAVFFTALVIGYKNGYENGLSEGVAIANGDKWDCAYSYSTGFLMCDRTPKYK